MTTTAKVFIDSKQAESTQTTQYTCNVLQAIIDSFTITNTTAANAVFSINLVKSGDTVGDDNCILHEKIIRPSETYRPYEVIGQYLEDGDYVSTLSDTGSALTIRSSGREVT